MKGRISEVFQSWQGEGLYLGEKQIFVRFFSCNLSCKFCDTKLNSFTEYEPGQLYERLKSYPTDFHSISFTGGEPLLQKDFLKEVLKLTHKNGIKNYLETNGTLYRELEDIIEIIDIIAMDLKLPSSSGMGDLWDAHRKFLKIACNKGVFLKAVICQSTQEKDLTEAIKLIKAIDKNLTLVLQPNSFEDDLQLERKSEQFRDICMRDKVTSYIIPQFHKAIGIR